MNALGRLGPALPLVLCGCLGTSPSPYHNEGLARLPETDPQARAVPAESPERLDGEPLTLEAATGMALSRNPDVRIAIERVRQAEARRREANAAFLPFLGADTSYLRADAPSQSLFKTIDARKLTPGTDFNDPGTFGNFESGLTARYNLFNGGRDLLDRRSAEAGEAISRLDRLAVENALVASVVLAFYDVLMAAELVETARASVETVRAQLRETETRWREGKVLKSDVLALELRLAEAEERQIRSENGRRLAVAALANLLGLDADAALELAGDDSPAESVPESYEAAIGEALLGRPELERARKRVERAGLELAAARRAFLPRVDAEARSYWDDPDLQYSGGRTNWFVGVSVSWNLFEGGSRVARVARSRALLDELENADRKQALAVQLDVKSAHLRLEEARARVKVTEASVDQAEESLSLVRAQYEGGTATVTRYLEAELALTRARMRRTNALFDLKKATADLARSLGRFSRDARGE